MNANATIHDNIQIHLDTIIALRPILENHPVTVMLEEAIQSQVHANILVKELLIEHEHNSHVMVTYDGECGISFQTQESEYKNYVDEISALHSLHTLQFMSTQKTLASIIKIVKTLNKS